MVINTLEEFAVLPDGTEVELYGCKGIKISLENCDFSHYILTDNINLEGGHPDAIKEAVKHGYRFKYAYTISCNIQIKVLKQELNIILW